MEKEPEYPLKVFGGVHVTRMSWRISMRNHRIANLRASLRDSKSFLNVRNRDFGEKLPFNSLSKWL